MAQDGVAGEDIASILLGGAKKYIGKDGKVGTVPLPDIELPDINLPDWDLPDFDLAGNMEVPEWLKDIPGQFDTPSWNQSETIDLPNLPSIPEIDTPSWGQSETIDLPNIPELGGDLPSIPEIDTPSWDQSETIDLPSNPDTPSWNGSESIATPSSPSSGGESFNTNSTPIADSLYDAELLGLFKRNRIRAVTPMGEWAVPSLMKGFG
jgi:hypothetical protein